MIQTITLAGDLFIVTARARDILRARAAWTPAGVGSGRWRDGTLECGGPGMEETVRMAGGLSPSWMVTLDAVCRPYGPSGEAAVGIGSARAGTGGDAYYFRLGCARPAAGERERGGPEGIRIVRQTGGTSVMLGESALTLTANTAYKLVLAGVGPRLMLYVNGEKALDVFDNHPLQADWLAISAGNARIRWSGADIHEVHFHESRDALAPSFDSLPERHRERLRGVRRFVLGCALGEPAGGLFARMPGDSQALPPGLCHAINTLNMLGALEETPEAVREGWIGRITGDIDPRFGVFTYPGGNTAEEPSSLSALVRPHDVTCRCFALLGQDAGEMFTRAVPRPECASEAEILGWLERENWREDPWGAGSNTQWMLRSYAGALRYAQRETPVWEAAVRWLADHQDEDRGMWGGGGEAHPAMVINGYYKLSRWLLTPFGIPINHADKVLGYVLDTQTPQGHWGDLSGCGPMDGLYVLYDAVRRLPPQAVDRARVTDAVGRTLNLLDANADPEGGYPFALVEKGTARGRATLDGTPFAVHSVFMADAIERLLEEGRRAVRR